MKEYFSHDYDATGDEKIIRLLRDKGPAGYGIFWMLVEMLYKAGGSIPKDYSLLAYEMRTDSDSIKNICEDFGLFQEINDRIQSPSVDRRLQDRAEKSQKAQAAASIRWSGGASAMRPHSVCNATGRVSRKKRKEEERRREYVPPLTPPPGGDFDQFWEQYPKKSGKGAALKAWKKAKPPLATCLATLDWQKHSNQWTRDHGQFIPMPATWLNQSRWLDEPDGRISTAKNPVQTHEAASTTNQAEISRIFHDRVIKAGKCAFCGKKLNGLDVCDCKQYLEALDAECRKLYK
jgi:uncharacterized protein YdaU (DUF1376 family)